MDHEKLLHALHSAFEKHSGVAAVLLFGSRARGRERDASDIDVAVLLGQAPPPETRYGLMRELLRACVGHVATERVDLVLLNDAPVALAFQVLKHGELVLCRDPVALHRFRVAVYRAHADYEPVERLFRRATRDRARKEAARG